MALDRSLRQPLGSGARPIGVFDSGAGGLTVARALMDLLPDERPVYLGDTARGPYGPRRLDEVRAFSEANIGVLASAGAKLVVAACNTATAALGLATGASGPRFPAPVLGVIAPAVAAAVRATRNGRIGVIGTEVTIASGAYDRAVATVGPEVKLFSQPCPEFVAFVEAGRTTDPEVLESARQHLAALVAAQIDTLILGCTHYPLLTGVLSYVLGPEVALVSSAEETAREVFRRLVDERMMSLGGPRASHRILATGDRADFAALAGRFLGPRVTVADIEPVAEPGLT